MYKPLHAPLRPSLFRGPRCSPSRENGGTRPYRRSSNGLSLSFGALFALALATLISCDKEKKCYHDDCSANEMCLGESCEVAGPPGGPFIHGSQMLPCINGWSEDPPLTRYNEYCLSKLELRYECVGGHTYLCMPAKGDVVLLRNRDGSLFMGCCGVTDHKESFILLDSPCGVWVDASDFLVENCDG